MKKILAAISAVVLMASCQTDKDTEARFEVIGLKDSYSFQADLGQKEQFKVISDNQRWEIDMQDRSWLTISPMRSLGGYETVTISPADNETSEERVCTFTLVSENGYTKTVTVTQAGL